MPMAAQVGCCERDDGEVALADADLAVAAGAHVRLACFVGLHAPHLDLVVVGPGHDHTR